LQDLIEPARGEVLVAEAEGRVHQLGPDRVVLLRDAHEAADHPRDDWLGHLGDQVATALRGHALEDPLGDRADPVLVLRDPLRHELLLNRPVHPAGPYWLAGQSVNWSTEVGPAALGVPPVPFRETARPRSPGRSCGRSRAASRTAPAGTRRAPPSAGQCGA